MHRTLIAPFAFVLMLLSAGTGDAQSTEHGPLVLQLAPGAAAQGLGGAFPLARPTSDAVFAHPGVLDEASGISLSAQTYGSGGTLTSVSGAREWWSGGVAVGVQALTYATAPSADPSTVPDEAALFEEGRRSTSELVATAGYARSVLGVRAGVGGKWIERRTGSDRDRTVAVDVGVARELGDVTVALTARNLGPNLDDGGTDRMELPREISAAGAFRGLPAGPLDLGAAFSVSHRADGEVIPGGGVEVSWWPIYGRTFVGRVGYRRTPEDGVDPLTLGAGFWGDDIGLEYAYRGADGGEGIHRFGLRWR